MSLINPNSLCTVSVGDVAFPLPLSELSVLVLGEESGETLLAIDFFVYEPRWQSLASLSVIASSSANTWNKLN